MKFNYFVIIDLDMEATDVNGKPIVAKFLTNAEQRMLIPLVKSVDLPGAKISTDRMNQYNHWRLSQSKIDFDPVTLTFHDVVDGKTLRFWEMYYEYYFKEALDIDAGGSYYRRKQIGTSGIEGTFTDAGAGAHDTIAEHFDTDFGYNLETVKNKKNLIKSISIVMVHAQSYSKVDLVNPRITDFKHDSMAYDSTADLMELSLTIEYEYFLYDNHFTPLTTGVDSIIDTVYGRANNLELEKFAPERGEMHTVRQRDEPAREPDPNAQEKIKDTSVLGNLERDVRGIIGDLPNSLGRAASQSILTGKFESPLNADAIKNQLIGNVKGQTKAVGSRQFGALVTGVTESFTDVARDAIPDPDDATNQ